MDPYRGTGRTTQVLFEAYEYRESATEQLPILIYAASCQDAERLVKMFCDLAQARGSVVVRMGKLKVVLDGAQHFEFRGYSNEEDSPPGQDYSFIFVDHYAWELIHEGPHPEGPIRPLVDVTPPVLTLLALLKIKVLGHE